MKAPTQYIPPLSLSLSTPLLFRPHHPLRTTRPKQPHVVTHLTLLRRTDSRFTSFIKCVELKCTLNILSSVFAHCATFWQMLFSDNYVTFTRAFSTLRFLYTVLKIGVIRTFLNLKVSI